MWRILSSLLGIKKEREKVLPHAKSSKKRGMLTVDCPNVTPAECKSAYEVLKKKCDVVDVFGYVPKHMREEWVPVFKELGGSLKTIPIYSTSKPCPDIYMVVQTINYASVYAKFSGGYHTIGILSSDSDLFHLAKFFDRSTLFDCETVLFVDGAKTNKKVFELFPDRVYLKTEDSKFSKELAALSSYKRKVKRKRRLAKV
jgi:hypothetical protein